MSSHLEVLLNSKIDEKYSQTLEDEGVDMLPIKQWSLEQRLPDDGEPVCTMCGKYGEYICDATEEDVCSIECKNKSIQLKYPRTDQTLSQHSYTQPSAVESKASPQDFELSKPQKKLKLDNLPNSLSRIYDPNPLNPFLHPFEEDKSTLLLTNVEVERLRQQYGISVSGNGKIGGPLLSFEGLKVLPGLEKLFENLRKENYIAPTSIQKQVIPVALQGRDVIVTAPTGEGKTLSFLLPIVYQCAQLNRLWSVEAGPFAMILCPTRELAIQTETKLKSLMQGIPHMKSALLVGGKSIPNQVYRLQSKVQVVVGTPGRVHEIATKFFDFKSRKLCILIIDEVDAIFQLGLHSETIALLDTLPQDNPRQTLLFTATLTEDVKNLSKYLLQNPVKIQTIISEDISPISPVYQTLLWVPNNKKKDYLFDILDDSSGAFLPPILVFVSSKIGAELLSDAITKKTKHESYYLHGGLKQEDRELVLEGFVKKAFPILVSTAVLGRGMDLVSVHLVINFDMAQSVEDYIHQVGRATAFNKEGAAITFINEDSSSLFHDLLEYLKKVPKKQLAPIPLEMRKVKKK